MSPLERVADLVRSDETGAAQDEKSQRARRPRRNRSPSAREAERDGGRAGDLEKVASRSVH
jgi:hypothetical protein